MMITYTQEELSSIVHAFAFPGTITDWTPHGNGHINDTFLVRSTENGVLRKSILQRMNRTVFHNPTELMQNIAQVTSFLRKKITAAGGDPFRETLNLIPTTDDAWFFVDERGEFWRAFLFISNASCYDAVTDPKLFYETGNAFGRFQQMLSDIEAGLINCVIVKDLSRLGRNVIDTGYYIERYFPMQKVRFIAVNDRYDSSSPDNAHDGIIIPLRNMINEAYAMDIARKIKAQQRQAMKDGKYVGGRTPYGYLKAPDDCHQLIVDPVAAEVVKTMFQWAAEGAGLNTIAVRLNEAGYLSPSHYKRTLGEITHENLVGNGHWQTRTVAKILRAEVYTGDLVQGVSKIIDHKQVRASADEWTTVRGTHEAIISRELFAAVQKTLDQAAQQAKDREIHSWSPNLLRGKIFCAHCGHSLHRQKCVRRKSQEVYVYHCISNNRIKKGVCPGAFIFEKELLDALADMIQEQLDTTLGQYSLGLENLSKEAEEQKNIQAKIASRKQEIQQLRTYQRGLYEGLQTP